MLVRGAQVLGEHGVAAAEKLAAATVAAGQTSVLNVAAGAGLAVVVRVFTRVDGGPTA